MVAASQSSPPTDMPLMAGLTWATGRPPQPGNEIEALKNGDEIFPAMLDAIESARHCVYFTTFVYWTGEIAARFARALADAAGRGVDVRIILDAFGSHPMDPSLVETMEERGARVVRFRPMRRWRIWQADHRTHRRVLVVDHTTAFTGGVGIAKEWTGDARDPSEWRDTHFRITGPAVSGVFAGFVDNWNEIRSEEPCLLPENYDEAEKSRGAAAVSTVASSPSSQWSPVATLYREVWSRARSHIRLCTPYFVPDEITTQQMLGAMERGVNVEVIIPGPHTDKRVCRISSRPEMATLVERGAEILAYQRAMFHLKVLIVDDEVAIFGTANFNHRSLGKDDEIVAIADCPRLIETLNAHFDEDRHDSEPWRPARGWRRVASRLSSALFRPFREQFRVRAPIPTPRIHSGVALPPR